MYTSPFGSVRASGASGEHFVRFYEADDFLVDEVVDFLDVALRAGDAAIVIATAAHRAAIHQRLRGLGARKGMPAWYSGELVMLDAHETLERFLVDGRPDGQRFKAVMGEIIGRVSDGGAREVRAFGEMVAVLFERGCHDEAVQLEHLWNELAEHHLFSLFCAYPMRLFASHEHRDRFHAVCSAHHRVHPLRSRATADDGTTLAALQQRTLALEAEVAKRRCAEQTLRQREKELADFLDNAVEGLHRVGPDGTILWANRAELELLGYADRPDEYIGQHIAAFHADGDVIADILARLGRGETLHNQPARLRCRDGSIKHVLIHSNAHFEDGQLAYTRCFSRDISDRVERDRLSAERDVLLEELTAASRAKDEFFAMLGHELRNPLSPIVTALQLMRMRGDASTAREQAIIQRQVDHLMRLVDDLLDVSRITRGKVELQRAPVDLADVFARAVEIASPLLEQRHHHLSVDVPRGTLRCDGDAVRLAQVVSNLLTNAARYTPVGGEVALCGRAEGDELVVTVRDNGNGIPADMLPRVFDLFFQGGRTIQRAEGGLGLGLALVKSLVELHGGRVAARSGGPGRGSEFEIRLPAGVSAAAHEAPAPCPTEAPAFGLRVLVVDDNVDAALTLGHLLRENAHEVQVVHDPVEALAAAAAFLPEVALLDIGLPVMDGYELATQLRLRLGDRPCRFLALTGYGQENDRARSAAAGFEAHLVKPVHPDRLLALVGAPRAATN